MAGVDIAADGSLLISDEGARIIWRVSYKDRSSPTQQNFRLRPRGIRILERRCAIAWPAAQSVACSHRPFRRCC